MWSHIGSSYRRRVAHGFTLLELLVSISILALMMTVIYQTTMRTAKAKARAEARASQVHDARVTLTKAGLDLSMAFLLRTPEHLGLKRGSPSMKTIFRGINNWDQDRLYFTTLSHRRLFKGARESEQCEVEYKVEADPKDPTQFQLVRRESKEIDDKPEEGGVWVPLLSGLKKFNVSFYDPVKKEWTEEWNSEADVRKERLPRAVKLTLVFPDPVTPKSEREKIYSTVALVGLYASPIDF